MLVPLGTLVTTCFVLNVDDHVITLKEYSCVGKNHLLMLRVNFELCKSWPTTVLATVPFMLLEEIDEVPDKQTAVNTYTMECQDELEAVADDTSAAGWFASWGVGPIAGISGITKVVEQTVSNNST